MIIVRHMFWVENAPGMVHATYPTRFNPGFHFQLGVLI